MEERVASKKADGMRLQQAEGGEGGGIGMRCEGSAAQGGVKHVEAAGELWSEVWRRWMPP